MMAQRRVLYPELFTLIIGKQHIQRALQITDIVGHDVRVDLRGLDIRMAKQFLEDADIDSVFQHMSGETMAQGVATNSFVDSRFLCGPLHRFLQG